MFLARITHLLHEKRERDGELAFLGQLLFVSCPDRISWANKLNGSIVVVWSMSRAGLGGGRAQPS